MRKNYLLTSLLVFLYTISLGQNRDFRGQLIPEGRVTNLSVSPQEKLWIGTYLGGLYYANNFDSTWHIYNTSRAFNFLPDVASVYKPNLNRISFFNEKVAILTGYIALEKGGFKNGLYRTEDGGITWEPIKFFGEMWVYDAFVNNDGQAWMGGSSGRMQYSNDFGKTWNKRPSPFHSIRIKSIFMTDSLNGVIGTMGHHGGSKDCYILLTTNNWETADQIETPLNQGIANSNAHDLDIEEVYILNNWLIVQQGGDYFYSDKSNIEWEKINIDLSLLTIDKSSKNVYGITDSLEVIEIIDFKEFILLHNFSIKRKPKNITSVNDCIYILDEDNEIYKVNREKANSTLLYSNEVKIEAPIIQANYQNVTCGIEGKQILQFDNNVNKWYRSGSVDFYIHDFYLINEDEAILWNGLNSHKYSLLTNKLELHEYKQPLSMFLNGNIKNVIINCGRSCGYAGCHGVSFNQIDYVQSDSLLYSKNYIDFSVGELGANRKEKKRKFKYSFNPHKLSTILTELNQSPYTIPKIKDLGIIDTDLIFNESNVEKINSKTQKSDFEKTTNELDKYMDEKIDEVVSQNESVLWSTCNEWFVVSVINENNDTLTFTKQYFADSKAFYFPWTVNFGKFYFTSYNLSFSQFIDTILPEKFRGKEYFENNVFLIELNDYLRK